MKTLQTSRHRGSRFAAVCAAATALAAASVAAQPAPVQCAPDNGGIVLPPGFCASVFADRVGRARHIDVSPSGTLYVALADSPDGTERGGILALADTNGDGVADQTARFHDRGGHGIDHAFGHLFFGENDRVVRYRLPHDQLVPADPPVTVVSGLPSSGDHPFKTVRVKETFPFFADLFVNIGSATDSCQVVNRAPQSPGIDPCVERLTRAGVWRFSAFVPGQTQPTGERFARGVRNATAIDFHPRNNGIYGLQNGRDELHENWPQFYTEEEDLVLPSEELIRIDRGLDNGWPYCYHDPARGKVLSPEYGGNGRRVGRCAGIREPLMGLPAHWAPLSMLFYTGRLFPEKYRRGAFVAFHGSRFQPEEHPAGPGYVVAFVPFDDGRPRGRYEIFADRFDGGGRPLPEGALHRAVGLAQGTDGSLYISDDKGGRIWKVVFTGQ